MIEVSHGSASRINELSGRVIDLYTKKEPYSGRGPNQSSDAFAPQEELFLCAKVTYNEDPVPDKLVDFDVRDPLGRLFGLPRTAVTNETGIATVDVGRLPNETRVDLFGIWHVYATVDIAEETVTDTLTFGFGRIVEIVSVATITEDLQYQRRFARGSCVGMELVLRNIALMNKTATLTVVVQDNQSTPFPEKVVFQDLVLKPGDTPVYGVLDIPEWAALGKALVRASAFTGSPVEGGVTWCPEVSTAFVITRCDVIVVNVVPSVREVEVGEGVEVNVEVINEGNEVESFDVSLYYSRELNSDYNWVFITKHNVTALAPGDGKKLVFVWNTPGVVVGDYWLKAVASVVPGETDVADNEKKGDYGVSVVTVRNPSAPAVLPRELVILLLISVGALAIMVILCLWYRKSGEMSRSEYEGGSSRRSFRSNPRDFGSSVKLRKSASLRPREESSYSCRRKESASYEKFREVGSLLQTREKVSSGGLSKNVSPAEFRETLSSLKRRKRYSGSSVFAVIRLPFVEEE